MSAEMNGYGAESNGEIISPKRKYSFDMNELLEMLEGRKPEAKSEIKNNLMILKGNDKNKYLEALTSLGYTEEKINNVEEIKIDKSGFSKEIADIAGENYLLNNIIVVNKEQPKLDLINKTFSFMPDLLQSIYNNTDSGTSKIIDIITPSEALLFKFDAIINHQNKYISEKLKYAKLFSHQITDIIPDLKWLRIHTGSDSLSENINYRITFETPNNSIEKIMEMKKKINEINDEQIINETYTMSLLDEILPLNKKYTNIKEIEDRTIPSVTGNSFKIKASGYELYCISDSQESKKSNEAFIVIFGKKFRAGLENIINGENKEQLYDELLKKGYLSWSKERGIEIMEEIEADIIRTFGFVNEKNYDAVRDAGLKKVNELDYFRVIYDKNVMSKFKKDWFDLRDAIYNNEFSKLNLEMKMVGTSINTQNKYVCEIFAKINPDDLLLNYMYNEDDFGALFQNADIERKKTILTGILTLDNSQLNQANNSYLLENHKQLLNEVKLYDRISKITQNYAAKASVPSEANDNHDLPNYDPDLEDHIGKSRSNYSNPRLKSLRERNKP